MTATTNEDYWLHIVRNPHSHSADQIRAARLHLSDAFEKCRNELTAANERIRELETKLSKAKDIPMKYKRMEFNAQLQDENTSLRTALTAEREVSDKLEEALRAVMEWQVVNMNKWNNPAYDFASKTLAEVAALRKGKST